MSLKHHLSLLRLHGLVPVLLLFIPCLWGLFLGGGPKPSLSLMCLFLLGSFFARTAGCVYNDWVDQPLDRLVARCANRPLAASHLKTYHGVMWFCLFMGLALGVLICLPSRVFIGGVISFGLIMLYPWMKRITRWPQIIMGMAFTMGLPMAYACYKTPSWSLLFLYLSGVWWAVFYDTLYAHQDSKDDIKAGVKSTTQIWVHRPKSFLVLCFGLWYINGIAFGLLSHFNGVYYSLLSLPLVPTLYYIKTCDLTSPPACMAAFKKSLWIGIIHTMALYTTVLE